VQRRGLHARAFFFEKTGAIVHARLIDTLLQMDGDGTALSVEQKASLVALVRMAALRVYDMLPKLQPEGLEELTEVCEGFLFFFPLPHFFVL
jgi:hypothetical protein